MLWEEAVEKKITVCLLRVPNQTPGTEKDLIILNFCTHMKSTFVKDARILMDILQIPTEAWLTLHYPFPVDDFPLK